MKKWLCKKGIHSFKIRIEFDPMIDAVPKTICLWCEKDIQAFGKPPQKLIDLNNEIQHLRTQALYPKKSL